MVMKAVTGEMVNIRKTHIKTPSAEIHLLKYLNEGRWGGRERMLLLLLMMIMMMVMMYLLCCHE